MAKLLTEDEARRIASNIALLLASRGWLCSRCTAGGEPPPYSLPKYHPSSRALPLASYHARA